MFTNKPIVFQICIHTPVDAPSWEYKNWDKQSHGKLMNTMFYKNDQGQKHPSKMSNWFVLIITIKIIRIKCYISLHDEL